MATSYHSPTPRLPLLLKEVTGPPLASDIGPSLSHGERPLRRLARLGGKLRRNLRRRCLLVAIRRSGPRPSRQRAGEEPTQAPHLLAQTCRKGLTLK